MLILLIFLSTSMRIEAGRELTTPIDLRKKPGPQGTIAKTWAKRKQKSQKRPEKCRFFAGGVEIAAKTAGCKRFQRRSGGSAG